VSSLVGMAQLRGKGGVRSVSGRRRHQDGGGNG
jgi:hypothetical protein